MEVLRLVPIGFEQLNATDLSSAKKLAHIPTGGADCAVFSAEVAGVRYRDDGTAPTSAIGVIIPNGVAPWGYFGDLAAIQFIAASGSPLLNVAYYKIVG